MTGDGVMRFVRARPRAWPTGPQLSLDDREVDVHAFSLAAAADDVEPWRATLSRDERDRAARFTRAADRDAFIVAHGALRALLARYCDAAPRALRFSYGHRGKPRLVASSVARPVTFSLAHSAQRALVAVGIHDEIGIDLERVRDGVDVGMLAAEYFTAGERRALAAASGMDRVAAFLRHWVAKEAVLKAHGSGLSTPLDAFAVRFAADGRTAAIEAVDGTFELQDYGVRMLRVPAGWHAALCAPAACAVRVRTPSVPAGGQA
jgi:4'-phosphopantetheinyl transferase